ncbi:f-box only protein [Anaeramoeba ignava]|uniref:F-box only protein n=1 Tax=Anaeramoeba ignava TaxID=1746090 RepID=A0A9Q0LTC7_ANAIG|nr:f-box only protein [Anaeramoeba ignava]
MTKIPITINQQKDVLFQDLSLHSLESNSEFSFDLNYFEELPDELLLLIFLKFEKPCYLGICSCVNHQFYRVSNDWTIWKQVLKDYQDSLDFQTVQQNKYNSTISAYGQIGLRDYFANKSSINQDFNESDDSDQNLIDHTELKIKKMEEKFAKEINTNPKQIFVQKINELRKAIQMGNERKKRESIAKFI